MYIFNFFNKKLKNLIANWNFEFCFYFYFVIVSSLNIFCTLEILNSYLAEYYVIFLSVLLKAATQNTLLLNIEKCNSTKKKSRHAPDYDKC